VDTLRHTPAGIPLVTFRLAHASRQIEAGHPRTVECEVNGVALGEQALEMAARRTGEAVRVLGFLSRKNRMSAQLVLHATRTESVEG